MSFPQAPNNRNVSRIPTVNHKQPIAVPERRRPAKTFSWGKHLEVGRKLGKGQFGSVFLTRDRCTKKLFAVKSISKEYLLQHKIEDTFKQEVENLALAQHPNVIKVYGWYHTRRHVQIVMEYAAKGELYHILMADGPFSSKRAANYTAQVAAGLRFCHSLKIIHRDIKPENLLLGADNRIRICDFGSSVECSRRRLRTTLCGTLDYLAPELVNHTPYDKNVDNWALGVLAFEFLTRSPMFNSEERTEVLQAIKAVQLRFPPGFDKDAQSFISALLVEVPWERMRLEDVPKHRWIIKYAK